MVTVLIVLVCVVVVYLVVGYRIALWQIPDLIAKYEGTFSHWRKHNIRIDFILYFLLWPGVLVKILIKFLQKKIDAKIDKVIESYDPEVVAEKVRKENLELQRRIAELESDLGMSEKDRKVKD